MGPTGWTVARNLARLRDKRDLSLRALSAALTAAGQPINPDGLNRAEKGTRQVTTDELVALAAVLDVSPVGLLFPVEARGVVSVTGVGEISAHELWEWVEGRTPLTEKDDDGDWADQFVVDSRPVHLAQPDINTPAGRRRFAREVQNVRWQGRLLYEVTWGDDGEVTSIITLSPDDPPRRETIWPSPGE